MYVARSEAGEMQPSSMTPAGARRAGGSTCPPESTTALLLGWQVCLSVSILRALCLLCSTVVTRTGRCRSEMNVRGGVETGSYTGRTWSGHHPG